jgi:hypothetical protein
MKETNFYLPNEINERFKEIAPVYQNAFSGEPWFEVSKCVSQFPKECCPGGFSPTPVGEICKGCGNIPKEIAYREEELLEKFQFVTSNRLGAWYLEEADNGILFVSIAWKEFPERIATEKYQDVPLMKNWMISTFGDQEIIWLDEVFADRSKRPAGNLLHFSDMCLGFGSILNSNVIAFRTKNERMLASAKKNFGENATIFKSNIEVPDRREFISIVIK